MKIKLCARCGEIKRLEDFVVRYTRIKRTPVAATFCKECHNEECKRRARERSLARWKADLPQRTVTNLLSEAELHARKWTLLCAEIKRRHRK